MIGIKKYLLNYKTPTKKALSKINKFGGISLVITKKKNILEGVLSNADLRKAILNKNILNKNIEKIYNKKPNFVYEDELKLKLDKISYNVKRIIIIPVIQRRTKKIVDILDFYKIKKLQSKSLKKLNASIVIMAGGKGKRLLPFTSVLPKPLLPIKEKPAIKHIIDKFQKYGQNEFYITANYKSTLLNSYFQNNKKVKIIFEKKPLGTAGGLINLKNKLKKHFFLTNCDTIINSNYNKILSDHIKSKCDVTIVVSEKNFRIPYGVCEKDNGKIKFIEKPMFKFKVSTGFYVLKSDCLKILKKQKYLDFNDFLKLCSKSKKKINYYKINKKDWIDIGQMDKYQNTLNK